MTASTYERLKKIIVEQLGVDEAEIKPEASFVDDLNADSLDLVELVMSLEEEFGTEISDEDAESIRTVQRRCRLRRRAPQPVIPDRGRCHRAELSSLTDWVWYSTTPRC